MIHLLKTAGALLIIGSTTLVTAYIPLSLTVIVTMQLLLAVGVLAVWLVLRKSAVNKNALRPHRVMLIVSGAVLGVGTALTLHVLSQGAHTSAALFLSAMPLFATVLMPLFLKEKLVSSRLLCLATSLTGAILLSGFTIGGSTITLPIVLCSLGAAGCFAAVLLWQKTLSRVPTAERLFHQLLAACVVVIGYCTITDTNVTAAVSGETLLWLLVLGVVHAVIGGILFLDGMQRLSLQKTALLCYLVPAASCLWQWLWWDAVPSSYQIIGMVLIAASSVVSEWISKK